LQAFAQGWSPDGTQILFHRAAYSGTDTQVGGFYILNLHSKRIRRLTPVRIRYDAQAAWGK
jgi:Tol biopolymer transport system component